MTVQMTMEEYEKLKSASDRLDAIKEEVDAINSVTASEETRRKSFFGLMAKLGVKSAIYRGDCYL